MRFELHSLPSHLAAFAVGGRHREKHRLNPVIDLLEQGKPVFGLYWPTNPMGRRGAPPPPDAPKKTVRRAGERGARLSEYSDFLFSGSMEGGVDRGLPGLH